ncbi:1-acyl-sn-glycerol-3-phosphate acyltransferase [bacterium SCSIO 12643]|nr:1-acyl-sn-glycerol-3-phosphate acyltransferase [bacterium SCSIO 12643]
MQKAFYIILRIYVRLGLSFFYRNFKSVKHPKFEESGSIIFAPTHQNAFMDALAVVMTQNRFSYFLTQAKVFQSKIGAKFFGFIYMMPIYRERDGMHTVKRNKKIIDKCVDVIIEGEHPLTIFPEGNHNLRRAIRPVQKGIARIAFSVLDKNPDTDLKIVPIGINYSAHRRFRSDLFVKYGEPFRVKPFYKSYLENNNKGYIELLAELDKRMRPLTIDMPRGLKYHQVSKEWVSNASGTHDLEASFDSNQKLLDAIVNETELPPRQVSDTPKWVKVLFFPFGLFMYINNFLAFKLVRTLTTKLAADPAFESSLDLVFGIFLSFIVYLLQAIIVGLFTSFNIGLIYFLSIPILNFIYFKIYKNSFVVE